MAVPLVARFFRILAVAVAVGWLGYTIVSWFLVWDPADAGAYYDVAIRLRTGGNLYPPMDPEAHEVFRYAPWFALAWIPLTLLPRDLATHLFSLAMVVCSALAVVPLLRNVSWASIAMAAIMGQVLLETAIYGNVQPAVVALLVWTAHARSFPVWVGVATSIKLVPIGFALVWIGRRQWHPAVIAILVATILFAPMLAVDLSNYVFDPGTGLASLYSISPALWFVVFVSGTVLVVWLAARGSKWAWVAAALMMFLGPPRVTTAYLAFVLVALELEIRDERRGRLTQ